jgi:hypothetical protein
MLHSQVITLPWPSVTFRSVLLNSSSATRLWAARECFTRRYRSFSVPCHRADLTCVSILCGSEFMISPISALFVVGTENSAADSNSYA